MSSRSLTEMADSKQGNVAANEGPSSIATALATTGQANHQFFRIGSFNILCDGLSFDEFFCDQGETNKYTAWSYRERKISDILVNMFRGRTPNRPSAIPVAETDDDVPACIVVTQENDHFYKLLRDIRDDAHCGSVAGIYGSSCKTSKTGALEHGTCFRIKSQRLLRAASTAADESLALQDKAGLYDRANKLFHDGGLDSLRALPDRPCDDQGRALECLRSYREECGSEFVEQAMGIYDNSVSEDDLYISDDGVGVYYDREVLELVDVGLPGQPFATVLQTHESLATSDAIALPGMKSSLRCLFRIKKHSLSHTSTVKYLLFYGAHLKSGEGVKEAIQRHSQLKLIVEDWKSYTAQVQLGDDAEVIPVIAMDSNNSKIFESNYPAGGSFVRVMSAQKQEEDVLFEATLSAYLHENGLEDGIHSQDTHFQGQNECLKMRNGKSEQVSKKFQLMFDTIDNIIVPSTLNIELNHKNYFGFKTYDESTQQYFRKVRTDKSQRRQLHDDCVANVTSACVRTALGPDSPLMQLYPNEHAPSDHPPVSIVFKF
jgi:hypothetical protein